MKLNKENIQNKKMNILIVESSIELRAFYGGAIKKSDKFEVITAASHTEALQTLGQNYENLNFVLFNWVSSSIPISIFIQTIKRNYNYVHIPLKAVVNSNRIRHEFPIESGARRGYDSAQRFYFIIAVSSSIL